MDRRSKGPAEISQFPSMWRRPISVSQNALEPPDQGYDVTMRRNTTNGWAAEGASDGVRPTSRLHHHRVTAIWDQSVQGPPAEVEVSVKAGPSVADNSTEGNAILEDGNVVVVRAEEALIVMFVLLLWVAAIALFFNRWGKIRMLEPYQPKFQQQHRQSCAMVESQSILPHRTSFSRTCLGDNLLYASAPSHSLLRPRQNSVFVGSTMTMAFVPGNTPRKTKSAVDIQSLIIAEAISEEKECNRMAFSRSHSPTAGFVPGNSLGVSCIGRKSSYVPGHSPILSTMRGNSLGGFGTPGRMSLLGPSAASRLHRNSICIERPSTSRGTYLTVTNV